MTLETTTMTDPNDDLTAEQIHDELLRAGITDARLEAAGMRVMKALQEARVKAQLDEAAKALGFDFGSPKCPKCGMAMIHTRLKGFVCMGRC